MDARIRIGREREHRAREEGDLADEAKLVVGRAERGVGDEADGEVLEPFLVAALAFGHDLAGHLVAGDAVEQRDVSVLQLDLAVEDQRRLHVGGDRGLAVGRGGANEGRAGHAGGDGGGGRGGQERELQEATHEGTR
jgi:hypothetical protein